MGNLTSPAHGAEFMVRPAKYGWVPDYEGCSDTLVSFPKKKKHRKIDLRKHFPPPYFHNNQATCISQALAALLHYEYHSAFGPGSGTPFAPSYLFMYYNQRYVNGDIHFDAGGSIKDTIATVEKTGVCREETFSENSNSITTDPGSYAYTEAKALPKVSFSKLQKDLDNLKRSLSMRKPFVFGFTVFESFASKEWDPRTETAPLPKPTEKILGGLAVVAVGYNDKNKSFIVRNNEGEKWGIKGYFEMPYKFIKLPFCKNFWTASFETVESEEEEEVHVQTADKVVVTQAKVEGYSIRTEH